jgi:hypothetical protein
MKKIELILFSILLFLFTSCKVIIPNYTTVENLGKLKPGMVKEDVLTALNNVFPHDIYNGECDGCEVHEYKYKHPYQLVNQKELPYKEGLRGNELKYLKGGNAFIVYKDCKLETVHTGEKDVLALLLVAKSNIKDACDPPPPVIVGCTDPESINYNPRATEDDGKCEYCPCGTMKNPNFNSKRPVSSCNAICIDTTKVSAATIVQDDCGPCDIINTLSTSNADLNVDFDLNEFFYRYYNRPFKSYDKLNHGIPPASFNSKKFETSKKYWMKLLKQMDKFQDDGQFTEPEQKIFIDKLNSDTDKFIPQEDKFLWDFIDKNNNGKVEVSEISTISLDELTKIVDRFFQQDTTRKKERALKNR